MPVAHTCVLSNSVLLRSGVLLGAGDSGCCALHFVLQLLLYSCFQQPASGLAAFICARF